MRAAELEERKERRGVHLLKLGPLHVTLLYHGQGKPAILQIEEEEKKGGINMHRFRVFPNLKLDS